MKHEDVEKIYKDCNALLEGHFLLSSLKHTQYYLQSAKVLENPKTASFLANALADEIKKYQAIHSDFGFDRICSPAIGGLLAGYELARAFDLNFIFTERVNGIMTLRRGFEVKKGERFLICEDIITTGKSALESASCLEELGGVVVGFAAIANRGVCAREGGQSERKKEAMLPENSPLFALTDFNFEIFEQDKCQLCKTSKAIKPGSRGN